MPAPHVDVNFNDAEVKRALTQAGRRGIRAAAEVIFAESQRRVPYRTRDLMNSGEVAMVDEDTVAISYKDTSAAAAHENMTVQYEHGREAKFLENAINEKKSAAAAELARALRQAID
jgi:hypothetical protein